MSRSTRILVVDDDVAIRSLLADLLDLEGYHVETAADGDQALRAITTQPFDCILLDIMMPGLDGHAVLQRIRQSAFGVELPVVMLTAHAGDDVQWQAWSAGANYVVTKPFDATSLLQYVQLLVQQQRATETPAGLSAH